MDTTPTSPDLREALQGIKADIRISISAGELHIDIGDVLDRVLRDMEPDDLASELGAREAVLGWAVGELAEHYSTPHWATRFHTSRKQFLAKVRERVYEYDLERLIERITEAERYRALYQDLWRRVPSEFLMGEPEELTSSGADWHESRRLWREELSAFLRAAMAERPPSVEPSGQVTYRAELYAEYEPAEPNVYHIVEYVNGKPDSAFGVVTTDKTFAEAVAGWLQTAASGRAAPPPEAPQ